MKTVNLITRINPSQHEKLLIIKEKTGYSMNKLINHGIALVIKYHGLKEEEMKKDSKKKRIK